MFFHSRPRRLGFWTRRRLKLRSFPLSLLLLFRRLFCACDLWILGGSHEVLYVTMAPQKTAAVLSSAANTFATVKCKSDAWKQAREPRRASQLWLIIKLLHERSTPFALRWILKLEMRWDEVFFFFFFFYCFPINSNLSLFEMLVFSPSICRNFLCLW